MRILILFLLVALVWTNGNQLTRDQSNERRIMFNTTLDLQFGGNACFPTLMFDDVCAYSININSSKDFSTYIYQNYSVPEYLGQYSILSTEGYLEPSNYEICIFAISRGYSEMVIEIDYYRLDCLDYYPAKVYYLTSSETVNNVYLYGILSLSVGILMLCFTCGFMIMIVILRKRKENIEYKLIEVDTETEF